MRVVYNRTVYQNPENGYSIMSYIVRQGGGLYKKNQLITAVGYYLPTTASVEYELEGEWVTNKKYGQQFEVSLCEPVIPADDEGIFHYLSCGLIKGVGVKTARLIVDAFGTNTLDILDFEPERLLEIKGISKKKLKKIVESHQSNRVMRELISILSPEGITIHKISQIYKEFGNKAVKVVKNDPYQMLAIDGFGFKTVDSVAVRLNISPNDVRRIEAAAEFVLEEGKRNGHLFLEKDDYVKKTLVVLNDGYTAAVVKDADVVTVVEDMVSREILINEKDNIYLKHCYNAEVYAAKALAKICRGHDVDYCVTDDDIKLIEDDLEICLAEKQKQAVKFCLGNNVSIITGGPGTGKTTTLKAILSLYKKRIGGDIVLMAPTGKAARRMEESAGMPASTIHSALNIYSDDFYEDASDKLDCKFVVVDEFSMVDMFLANSLFSMISPGTKVLLVGDPDQLPSIGAGNVFRELINCQRIPVTVLDVVYRQAETSSIISNAQKINTGVKTLKYDGNFDFVPANDDVSASKIVIREYLAAVNKYGLDNVQVLSPYRTKSESGVNRLNEEIQMILNPAKEGKPEVPFGKRVFRIGDRVMQTKNRNRVSNGDVGFICDILFDDDGDPEIKVEFSGGRVVSYEPDDLNILDLAYATTVHKSQGSEHNVVILVMLKAFYVMLKRNLLYTGVTRAKEKVVIVGHKDAVEMAIRKNDIDKRNTMFGERVKRA